MLNKYASFHAAILLNIDIGFDYINSSNHIPFPLYTNKASMNKDRLDSNKLMLTVCYRDPAIMYSRRVTRRQINSIRMTRITLPNRCEMRLDDLTGNSAGCLTDLTVTCGLVLCLRRSSLADNTGSSSLSAAAAAAAAGAV